MAKISWNTTSKHADMRKHPHAHAYTNAQKLILL